MSILILNRIDLSRLPYADLLPELADRLVLICSSHSIPEDPTQAEAILRRFKHVEILDHYERSGLVEKRALELHEQFAFERIIAVSEFDLLRAARLRDRLGLSGQNEASALAFRDKLLMKSMLATAGIPVPVSAVVRHPLDVLQFVEQQGLPVVIKPILGAGSVNTHIVRTESQLSALLDETLFLEGDSNPGLEIETYVAGTMYYIDGFRLNGSVQVMWPSRYLNTCHDFSHGNILGSFTLASENPLSARLIAFTERVLQALPTPETTAFHCEVFHTPEDEIILCEVASRVGGPRTPELFELSLGFDLVHAFVRGQAGLEIRTTPLCAAGTPTLLGGELLLPSAGGVLMSAPEECMLPGVLHYALGAEIGKNYPPSKDVSDFIASLLFSSSSEAQMNQFIEDAAQWFASHTTWASTPAQG